MIGAESVVRTLVSAGVEVCFANPGTSEIHFVESIGKVDGLRPILCLFEGVATGAADGYGRMAEKPASTLLHLGAGLANGLANLHNARRARTPVVNIIGGHATFHDHNGDSPLASDIEDFARPVSGWVRRTANSMTAAADAARAVQAALQPPGQVATLIVPADAAWAKAGHPANALPRPAMAAVGDAVIDRVAAALKNARKTAFLLRGAALRERGLKAAGRIGAKTGARLLYDTLTPRIERGAGRTQAERIPYFPEAVVDLLRDTGVLILVGATPPISIFGSPDQPSWLTPEGCEILYLAHEHEDGIAALEAVAEAVAAPAEPTGLAKLSLPELPTTQSLDPSTISRVIAHYLPENAIIADEAVSSGPSLQPFTATARPHDHLAVSGGRLDVLFPWR